jgi:hypothetical protein
MWRPAHGATTRPGPCRPTSGYGRGLGRPGPRGGAAAVDGPEPDAFEPADFGEPMGCASGVDAEEVETPAPVTP